VKGALYLDNPLITDIDKVKGMKLYDRLCQTAREYLIGDTNACAKAESTVGTGNKSA
jgi:hypothetical protein